MENSLKEFAILLSQVSDMEYNKSIEILSTLNREGVLEKEKDIRSFVVTLNELQKNYTVSIKWLDNPTKYQVAKFRNIVSCAIEDSKIIKQSGESLIICMKALYDLNSTLEILISQLESENLKRMIDIALDMGNKKLFMELTNK
jgi:hypothetical protein